MSKGHRRPLGQVVRSMAAPVTQQGQSDWPQALLLVSRPGSKFGNGKKISTECCTHPVHNPPFD